MPAFRRVSNTQLDELVAWMESHPLQARATQLNSSQAKQSSHRLWEELTSRLNAVGDGVTKTAKEWRQYWSDQKYKVRKKGSDMQQHGSGTGGGPSWDGILTPIEDRILSIMGVQNVMGNENARIEFDMGIDDSPSLLELPLSRPVTPDPTPSSSCHPIPNVAERANTTPPHTQPSLRTASQARPPKRKHMPVATDAESRPHTAALPRWALDAESSRIREEQMRRELEERRLEVEERRLELEERRLEEDRTWRRERLAMEERRLEEDRMWRRDLLSALQRVCNILEQPRPPSPFQ